MKVVLYLNIISSPTLTSVESFMLVSRIAQSRLLAALLFVHILLINVKMITIDLDSMACVTIVDILH